VALTSVGTACDFGGPTTDPTGSLTWDQYNSVVAVFPRLALRESVLHNVISFCKSKPQTTFGKLRSSYRCIRHGG